MPPPTPSAASTAPTATRATPTTRNALATDRRPAACSATQPLSPSTCSDAQLQVFSQRSSSQLWPAVGEVRAAARIAPPACRAASSGGYGGEPPVAAAHLSDRLGLALDHEGLGRERVGRHGCPLTCRTNCRVGLVYAGSPAGGSGARLGDQVRPKLAAMPCSADS